MKKFLARSNSIESSFDEIAVQKARKAEEREKSINCVKKLITQVIGKSGDYTIDEVRTYLTYAYHAQEIDFEEALEYIPDKYHIVSQCRGAADPISYLTENWLSGTDIIILLLPPLEEQTSSLRAVRNGCVLMIENNDNMPGSWWIGGNKSGYGQLYNMVLGILCNGGKGRW